ncbi:MAG: hypothetical protein KBS68_04815 [Clostridiales bacterium]|nr:hypothetical protein [Candidatus Crickella merdequi]
MKLKKYVSILAVIAMLCGTCMAVTGCGSSDDLDNQGTQQEETVKSASTSAVTPDFKKMMDEYEAFMDEYIAFMKKYESSDDTTSMMSDYMSIMSKYADFADKVDAVDEDSLSDADYEYYIDVTSRVSQKLLAM